MPTTPEKKRLHAAGVAARGHLSHEERREATEAIAARLSSEIAKRDGLIGAYVAFHDEFNPHRLLKQLAAQGRRLALPTTPRWGQPMVFRAWVPGEQLVRGRMDIPEPSADAPEVFPDICIVPPVAFDRRCFRVGYGAGFYDRTLPALRSRHPVFALGCAFACQEVDAVPDEPHDVPLDAIATEAGLIVRPPA